MSIWRLQGQMCFVMYNSKVISIHWTSYVFLLHLYLYLFRWVSLVFCFSFLSVFLLPLCLLHMFLLLFGRGESETISNWKKMYFFSFYIYLYFKIQNPAKKIKNKNFILNPNKLHPITGLGQLEKMATIIIVLICTVCKVFEGLANGFILWRNVSI